MKILFDHNTPAALRYALKGHQIETAYERGWQELSNGTLLSVAEAAGFELMITSDQSIKYQQNFEGRKIALLVINTNDWTRIRMHKELITSRIPFLQTGTYVEVEILFGRVRLAEF